MIRTLAVSPLEAMNRGSMDRKFNPSIGGFNAEITVKTHRYERLTAVAASRMMVTLKRCGQLSYQKKGVSRSTSTPSRNAKLSQSTPRVSARAMIVGTATKLWIKILDAVEAVLAMIANDSPKALPDRARMAKILA